MTSLELETQTAIEFLENFNPDSIKEFVSKIKPPVLLAAMGSSYYLPFGRTASIIKNPETKAKIDFVFASEVETVISQNWNSLVLISNSGKTREIINFGKKFPRGKLFAVTSDSKSELAQLTKNVYKLKSGKEAAVAATKSIIEQSVFCECLLRFIEGSPMLSREKLKQVAQAMKYNLSLPIDNKLLVFIAGAKTVYFAGGSCGIGEEVALKFCELGKKKARFVPGTQILHGPEEVIERGDLVFLLFADRYSDYFDRFKQMKEKTGAHFVLLGKKNGLSDVVADLKLVKGYESYCILAYFWNILTRFALIKGYSLDKGEKISKVGVSV